MKRDCHSFEPDPLLLNASCCIDLGVLFSLEGSESTQKVCMNEFNRKKERSLNLLRRTGMNEGSYLPPTFPFLWKHGIEVPPPHFIRFFPLLLIMGLPFGFLGLGIYMMDLGNTAPSLVACILLVSILTLIFGGCISLYYRRSRRMHRLPQWEDL